MRLALALTLMASAVAISDDARALEAPHDDATLPDLAIASDEQIAIPELVAMWSRRFDALAVIDPALNGSTVHFVTPVTTLTWGTMKAILDPHGAAVAESKLVDGPWVLRVYSRARLPNRPFAAPPEAQTRRFVTAVFSIAHGAGHRIFAALRQNVSEGRSNHRLGAVLYAPGPEQIVVVDRPATVRVLGELIETLDVDGTPRDLEPRRLAIEAEVWEVELPTDQLSIGVELAALGSRGAAGAIGLGLFWPQGSQDASRLSAIVDRDALDRVPLLLQEIAAFDEARLVTKSFAITDESTPVTFSLSNRGCFFGSTNMVPPPSAEDAAHTLVLAPRVRPGEDVALDVSLTSWRGADARTSTASVTVPNGRYAVFGLERETERTVEERVPLLGDLPLLGRAFRTWSRRVSRARVYMFVRPTLLAPAGPATSTRRGHPAERAAWLPASVSERP